MKHRASEAANTDGAGRVFEQITPNTADGTLFVRRHEESGVSPTRRIRSRLRPAIDPTLKSWIDNVIVPTLVDQWNEQHKSMRKDQ